MLPISFNINYSDFTYNPYPVFAELRNSAPISFVPELDAILLTKHSDIFICEKNISVFSSVQPDGLMTKLMGQNMMRKDGEDHKACLLYTSPSPRDVEESRMPSSA